MKRYTVKRQMIGYAWWTRGAQKGTVQPPYVVRWKNRWWRTKPISCAPAGSPENMSDTVRAALDVLSNLPYGAVRCSDYLVRANKQFGDLPVFDDEQAKMVLA